METAIDASVTTGYESGVEGKDAGSSFVENAASSVVGRVVGDKAAKHLTKPKLNVESHDAPATSSVDESLVAGGDSVRERSDFYIRSNGEIIPSTGYRAIGGETNIAEAGSGVIESRRDPTYFTFDDITHMTSEDVGGYLQLPRKPSHVVSFDTLQIIDDIKIPTGRWNTTDIPEPITETMEDWGKGGATQAITNKSILVNPPLKLKEQEDL